MKRSESAPPEKGTVGARRFRQFRTDLDDDGAWPVMSNRRRAAKQDELNETTGDTIRLGFSDADIREERDRIRRR